MTQAKYINIAIIKTTSCTTGLAMSVFPLFTPVTRLLCLIVTFGLISKYEVKFIVFY